MQIWILAVVLYLVSCNKYTSKSCTEDEDGNQHCELKDEYEEDDDEGPVFYDDVKWKGRQTLYQWDPVKVGHERSIEVAPGQVVTMKTAAVRPKAFLIDDFLTSEECDHIINKALNNGLMDSGLHIDTQTMKSKSYTYGYAKNSVGHFGTWDKNGDKEITMNEILLMAQKTIKLYMNETDTKEMFSALKLNVLDDDVITKEEFNTMNTAGIAEYMNDLRETHPRFRDRYSEQIWLRQGQGSDEIMNEIREKVIKLTRLPRYIVEGGEALQVLRYQPFGHYHAHFDSQDGKVHKGNCCHMDKNAHPTSCKLCRFITILYYLADVEEGGETAFPVADKEDYDHEEFRQRKIADLYNLSKFCHNASLVVKPKRGRAIMWYNHYMDDTKWLGGMDYYGLHGGCDIIKGIKWIANNWLVAPPEDSAHLDSLYLNLDAPGAF